MVMNSDFPAGNFDLARNVRQQQKRKWEESDTNKEPSNLKNKSTRVKFDKVSMFLSACSSSDLEEAKQLLSYGLDINSANPDGLTALHQACIYDKLDVVEFLLNNGADINCTDPEGWTPLHCAAYCGYSDITKLLIEKKANLSALNSNCELPLDLAMDKPDIYDLVISAMQNLKIDADAAKRSEETQMINDARAWLREGVRPSIRHPGSGATPLHVAAAKGYAEAIQLLIEAGADIDARDNDEWTPLMAAAHWSQIGSCELLIRAGANVGVSSKLGYNLDDIAADEIRSDLRRLVAERESRLKAEVAAASAVEQQPAVPATVPEEATYESGSEAEDRAKAEEATKENREISKIDQPSVLSAVPMPTAILSQNPPLIEPVSVARGGAVGAIVTIGEQPPPSHQASAAQSALPSMAKPTPFSIAPVTGQLLEDIARAVPITSASLPVRGTVVPVESQPHLADQKSSSVSSYTSSSDEPNHLSSLLSSNGLRPGDITSRTAQTTYRPPLAFGSNTNGSYQAIVSAQVPASSRGIAASNSIPLTSSTLSSNSMPTSLSSTTAAVTARQVVVPPITNNAISPVTSPAVNMPSVIGRARPVSAIANLTSDTSAFLTSTPKLSNSSPNTSSSISNSTKPHALDSTVKMLSFTNTSTQNTNTVTTSTGTTSMTSSLPVGYGMPREPITKRPSSPPSTPAIELSSSSSSSSLSSSPSPPSPSNQYQSQVNVRRPGQRPLSTLVASEDGAANRFHQSITSARSVPVYTMVHRSSSSASSSSRHAPAVNPTPMSPHPSRFAAAATSNTASNSVTPTMSSAALVAPVTNGKNDIISGSNITNLASRMRTPTHLISQSTSSLPLSQERSSATYGTSDDSSLQLPSSTGMVAVTATPVTAVTPQPGSSITPTSIAINATPPSGNAGSASRSAADEAEAERKARARHNRQTRRATQGVTLEDFTQAKTIAATDLQPSQPSVVATAAPVTTTMAPTGPNNNAVSANIKSLSSSQFSGTSTVAPVSTPVIGTVSPITQITPSVVYASSAMASSSGTMSSSSGQGGSSRGALTSSSSTSAYNNNNGSSQTASVPAATVPANNASSTRRRAPPRRSTGINQADVSEAAEALANSNGNSNSQTESSSGYSGSVAADTVGATTTTTTSTTTQPTATISSSSSSSSSSTSASAGSGSGVTSLSSFGRRDASQSSTTGVGKSTEVTLPTAPSSSSSSSSTTTGASSFLVEYDRLYELERAENDRLKSQTRQVSAQLTELQRDKRSLQRRVSELEEETRELERLRAENQRLKDENCALIRVISKLSK